MAIVTQQPFYTAAAVEEVLYNHGPIKIRKMMDTHEDCSFYAHLSTEAFTDKVVHATKESSERSSDLVPDFDCCDLCGLFCLDFATTENVPVGHCYIECICVDDKFRGKGIGKVLLNVVETDAKHHNCRTMYLWVVSSNRAKNLYSRQGYVVTENTTCCLRCILGVKKAYRMDKPV
ncbi:Hypothetical predicted protein [Mytilus galloprovincialis]|uniref:N-acetyltransferase domain-containing protein n=1 Tax=Mytilus galloprovincialis TaxID=29158 RepID=A0A8B6EBN0_MYTGA|nr:Hypothetical predicted protein [Mytilus galloprovincialis]